MKSMIAQSSYQSHSGPSTQVASESNPFGSPECAVTWNDLFLKNEINQAISQLGYHRPSEIQARAIPKIMQGKNVVCQAKAGMGKTAVFVIGILTQITPQVNHEYMPHQCIVIAHTRQLAYQIHKQFKRFGQYLCSPELRFGCYIGGLSTEKDMGELANKSTTPHVIIGTPGRLLDLVYRGYINARKMKYLVIDECDILLSHDGMRGEVLQIYKHFPKETQKVMVSATITQEISDMCKIMMPNYVEVRIDQGILDLSKLSQFYQVVSESHKFELLSRLLDITPFSQAIVFVNSISRAIRVSQLLDGILFNPITIHSELTQHQRISNYEQFKANGSRILVATNLFGRGIDIERVNLVINYDFPHDRNTYVHRIGRAGRFGTKGIVINFINECEQAEIINLKEFQRGMSCLIQRLPKNAELSQFLN